MIIEILKKTKTKTNSSKHFQSSYFNTDTSLHPVFPIVYFYLNRNNTAICTIVYKSAHAQFQTTRTTNKRTVGVKNLRQTSRQLQLIQVRHSFNSMHSGPEKRLLTVSLLSPYCLYSQSVVIDSLLFLVTVCRY